MLAMCFIEAKEFYHRKQTRDADVSCRSNSVTNPIRLGCIRFLHPPFGTYSDGLAPHELKPKLSACIRHNIRIVSSSRIIMSESKWVESGRLIGFLIEIFYFPFLPPHVLCVRLCSFFLHSFSCGCTSHLVLLTLTARGIRKEANFLIDFQKEYTRNYPNFLHYLHIPKAVTTKRIKISVEYYFRILFPGLQFARLCFTMRKCENKDVEMMRINEGRKERSVIWNIQQLEDNGGKVLYWWCFFSALECRNVRLWLQTLGIWI